MIFAGILFIPWQVRNLIAHATVGAVDQGVTCPRCGLRHHAPDARFCRRCGARLGGQVP